MRDNKCTASEYRTQWGKIFFGFAAMLEEATMIFVGQLRKQIEILLLLVSRQLVPGILLVRRYLFQ